MEMIIGQLWYFGASFLWGIVLMFLYDFLEIFRCRVRHGKLWLFIEDWIFWLVAAILFSDDICPESWYHPQFFCSFLYRRHGSVPGAGEETIYMRRAGCYFICMQALCVAAEEIQEKR